MKQLLSIFLLMGMSVWGVAATADDGLCWTGTWAAAAEYTGQGDMPAASLSGRALREVIHVSIGGERLRLQLSNEFGSGPVDIASIFVADAADSCLIDTRTARWLTFGGRRNVTIEPGETVFCDELRYHLKPLQRLAITINYGARTPEHVTSHRGSRTTSYIVRGAAKPKTSFAGGEKVDHWYNIAALDVMAPDDTPCIAIIGNSITDGRGSTTNAQNRWPDRMAEALDGKVAVLNLGIGGNCVVEGGLSEPALKRFDRDILGQRGVKTLVIFEGVNDIGWTKGNTEQRTEQLIHAYETLIGKARHRGWRVLMGTITPFKGNDYFTPFHEAARQVVNEWIRTTPLIDGVVDFDLLAADPADRQRLREDLSDDWLHLNAAGYALMGRHAATVVAPQP